MKIENLKLIVFDLDDTKKTFEEMVTQLCAFERNFLKSSGGHSDVQEAFEVKSFRIKDYTLWPFWVDTHFTPPFKKLSNEEIVDKMGSKIKCYPEVHQILKELHDEGYLLGVASRTSEIKGARQLIDLFGWEKYFSFKEIFPDRKTTHFNNIQKSSGINFDQMLFFDDEHRNISDVYRIGVVSVLVKDGLTKNVIEEGKQLFKTHT